MEEGREWRLPELLYADDLVLHRESKQNMKVKVVRFSLCRRRGLKVNLN